MTSPHVMAAQQRFEQAMADLERTRAKLAEIRDQLNDAQVSKESKDHLVTVTVNRTGQLTGIRFRGTRYRSLPTAELEALLVDTIGAAREEMLSRVGEAFQPLFPQSSSLGDLLSGRIGPDEWTPRLSGGTD
jgi:DNA-binding protein YbaB